LAKRKVAGGEQPYSVAFSPDGSRLAVGFHDTTKVEVLSSRDLSPLHAPDTSDVGNGNLSSVAWSADGRTLYAGGKAYDASGNTFIRVWSGGGRGAHRDVRAASDTIMHLLPLRGGGVAYGTFDPAFGVIDAGGSRTLFAEAAVADYRALLQDFLLAPDGAGVRFGYEVFGGSPARFSLAGRTLDPSPSAVAGWRAPVTESNSLRVTDWYNNYAPKLDGAPLPLEQYETSRSLAIAPGAGAFLLGTDWYVRLFGRDGKEVWNTDAPGAAWAVNVSADGRLAVAAFGDGTIRWYSMKDGRELLAFFPHADRKRWVVWTPSGYYDASPGGEELIGWHVNNGPDKEADFFPVSQFREAFYRPDVVARVLKTLDEQLAVKEANAEKGIGAPRRLADVAEILPPVVDIISPADGEQVKPGEMTVRYRLRAPSGEPVTSVMALVDGKTVALEHSLNLSAGNEGVERRITVRIPEGGASLVSVIAINRFAPSVAATARVTLPPRPRDLTSSVSANPADSAPKPALNVLAIGVGKYGSARIPGLKYPAKDAESFAALMKNQEGRRYSKVTTRVLADGAANRLEVTKALDWIRKETGENDFAMIFFAGHGMTEDGLYYFLPADADTEALTGTGVSFDIIVNTFLRIRGQKVLFIDTCRSGAVLGPKGVIDINGIANTLNKAQYGVAVFTASTGNESAEERDDWGNGAFTKALVEGLGGGASQGAGDIYFSMLDTFLTRRVRQLTNYRQTPTATRPLTVPDFPLAHAER
ncbi:MAG TPA: caspase family protein, partial [Pyrinomonadaceae bacterium]|nr:caspase family protein [Pyrinomonadaceae bacterium]